MPNEPNSAPRSPNMPALKQVADLWHALPKRKAILTGAIALLVGIGILSFAYLRKGGDYRPLYTSLSPEDAGTIVQKLKEKNIAYRLSNDGAAILVPQDKLAETRLEIAALGLPKSGRIGFELFDQTKFGATDFMEHVNFRRALEGELERSMTAMAEVESARVHLTFAKESVFSESRLPAKASVMLKLRSNLSEQNVSAVRYLVASAVEGLAPEAVSVVDMKGNLLGRPKEKGALDGPEPSEAVLEYRRSIEKDLLAKVNSTLEPLLGPDRFRASVVAECDFSSGEQSEETLDPDHSVITQEQHSKETSNAGATTGVPGTQSNLPRAVPRPGSTTQVMRETSNVSYQTTRTVKRIRLPQGNIKRLSVSVLVDAPTHWEGRGSTARRVTTPPTTETMNRITQVVSAAAGIVPDRGDKLVVETLPFETNQEAAPPAPLPAPVPWSNRLVSVQTLSVLLVVLVMGAGVWYVMRSQQRQAPEIAVATQVRPALGAAAESTALQTMTANPQNLAQQLAKQMEEQRKKLELDRQHQLEAAGAALQKLAGDVIELAQTDSSLCAGVLRSWLTEREPVMQEVGGDHHE